MMDIAKIIKNHKELSELPFLVVFRTMAILKEKGLLRDGLENAQPKP